MLPLFGELFSWAPLKWPEIKDLSELKDQGEYTEETEEKDDLVTKRVSFKSHDGATRIYREVTTSKNGEKWIQRSNLERKMIRAARSRNFEDAAKLRDELDALDKELKPPKNLESPKK